MRRTVDRGLRAALALLGPLFLAAPALSAEGQQGLNFGDLGQAIAALIIFALLLVILGRFAWKPLLAQIHRREQSLADALHRSQKREEEAAELLKQYRARMEQAEAEAKEVVSRGRVEAAQAREDVLAAARDEASRLTIAARAEIEQAKDAALRELCASAADLTMDVAERVIGKKLTEKDHAGILEESLRQIRRGAGEVR